MKKKRILLKTIYYPLQTNIRHREGPWVLSLDGRYLLFIFRQSKLSYIWDCRTGLTLTSPRWRPSLSLHCPGRPGCPCLSSPGSSPPPADSPVPPSSPCPIPRPCSWRRTTSVSTQLKFPRLKSSLSVGKSKTKVTVVSEISEWGSLLYRPQPYKYSDQTSMIR